MSRRTSTLFSLGVSAVLIALGVWLLYKHSIGIWPGHHRWVMGHHGYMGGGMGGVMIIFWIVLIGALMLLLFGVVNRWRDQNIADDDRSSPLEIIKQRYARGEIDKNEYEKMKQDILA